jgi:hypothetical protein
MEASSSAVSHRALAQISGRVDLQSNVLSFANSFWLLGLLVMFLIPLPSIMRRPGAEETKGYSRVH